MKKLIINICRNLLSKWIVNSCKNEQLLVMYLFLIKVTFGTAEILTDDDNDNAKQLEDYAIQELPELTSIVSSFLSK